MLTLDRRVEYKTVCFTSPKITPQMNGYTIAFITDIHDMSLDALREAADELNRIQPNLLALGGDFSEQTARLNRSLEILSGVKAPDGIYGVPGNHDNPHYLYSAMQYYCINPLYDGGASVREGLYIAGVTDPVTGNPDIAAATKNARKDDFTLLLSHNPDVVMTQETSSLDLILSGHTHGGQVTFFGLWAPALVPSIITSYGQRFKSGWSKSKDGAPIYISNGIGSGRRTPRVFARPQVILISLRSE